MADVAMFPLGSVLFPHTPLVLRVFEPRYLTMVGRLLDEEDRDLLIRVLGALNANLVPGIIRVHNLRAIRVGRAHV